LPTAHWHTEVGAHKNSDSPYDTFDQGGNVWEWNEAIKGPLHGLRGGSSSNIDHDLLVWNRDFNSPAVADDSIGFRVSRVSEVPELATRAVLVLGSVGVLQRRKCVRE